MKIKLLHNMFMINTTQEFNKLTSKKFNARLKH